MNQKMGSITPVMSMASTLGLVAVLMVSVASGTYAQAVGNEGSAGLISGDGSGQVLAHVLYNVNQLLLKLSERWDIPVVIIS
jgi:hypothetical protein